MEYISHKEISYCTVFNLNLSQDELEVYESCMRYVLEKCSEEEIYSLTGCKIDELKAWNNNLRDLLRMYVDRANLPDKY